MYENLVVLDKINHKTLKLSSMDSMSFASEMTHIPVTVNEVITVGSIFPIVFSADEDTSLIALVSLGSRNLGVNEEGKWVSDYIPSFLRKYPFALANKEKNSEEKIVLIDEESLAFSRSKGKQLFRKNGEESDVLKSAIDFLTSFEKKMHISRNVSKMIAQSGILEDRSISTGKGDEKKVFVNGFKVVNREKLNALSDDILADWVRKGIIPLIEAHLKSLNSIETLFNLEHKRQNQEA